MNQPPDLESDALRSEIDSTRGRMDETIDALENRLQGRHLVDEIVGFFRRGDSDGRLDEWKEKVSQSAGTVVDSVKAHPIPVLMIGAGIAWLIYQNRSGSSRMSGYDERNLDYTGEDYPSGGYESYGASSSPTTSEYEAEGYSTEGLPEAYGSSSLAGQAKEKLANLGNQAREKAADLTARGREKLGAARVRASEFGQQAQQRSREVYDRTRERVVTTADQHPLEVGIGFLALGVLAGLAIPTPQAVSRRLAPAGDRLRRASSDLVEKGKRVAQAATEAAKVEAKTQGLTVERVRDEAQAVAKSATEAARAVANLRLTRDGIGQEGRTELGRDAQVGPFVRAAVGVIQSPERVNSPAPRDTVAAHDRPMTHEFKGARKIAFGPVSPDDRHGRTADSPSQLPKKGWLDILARTKKELAQDNLSIVAAGVAFYCFLAFIPALGAVISIYALVADPAQVSQHLESLAQVMPSEILPMLREQMTRLAEANQAAGVSAVVGLLLALYSSSKAATALIQGLNITYDEEEKRGFFKLQAVALLLTLVAVVGVVVALGLVAVLPAVLEALPLGSRTETTRVFVALADSRRRLHVRARGAIPVRAESRRTPVAMGKLGRGCCDCSMGHGIGRILNLCVDDRKL